MIGQTISGSGTWDSRALTVLYRRMVLSTLRARQ